MPETAEYSMCEQGTVHLVADVNRWIPGCRETGFRHPRSVTRIMTSTLMKLWIFAHMKGNFYPITMHIGPFLFFF